MPHNEDYLDSLLDSVQGKNKKRESSRIERPKTNKPSSGSSFLDDFERDVFGDIENSDSKEQDFIRDFEAELGIEPDDSSRKDSQRKEKTSDSVKSKSIADILSEAEDETYIQEIVENETREDLFVDDSQLAYDDEPDEMLDSIEPQSTDMSDSAPSAETDDISTDKEDSEPDVMSDIDEGSEPDVMSDIDEGSEPDVMSDIDEKDANQEEGISEEDALKAIEEAFSVDEEEKSGDDDEIMSDIGGEESDSTQEDASQGDEGESEGKADSNMSQDEIMDIGDLLDSIDEEGNIDIPEEKYVDLVDETGKPVVDEDDDKTATKEDDEKKPGIFSKILGIFSGIFKKKKKDAEEEEGEASETKEAEDKAPEESGASGSGEEQVDEALDSKEAKKKAKKEEKERKKKEKEEAKKKAAEEKAKKKKDKTKKEKKQKAPDNSPKIPIKVLLPFILLSASLVVLWFVAQKTLGGEILQRSAKSNFDKDNYLDSYATLSGMEIDEEDEELVILYNRSKLMATLEYRWKTYEIYKGNEEIKAIDALVRGMDFYSKNGKMAKELGITTQFDMLGRQISAALSDTYGVSDKDAKDLLDIKERKEYTKELYYILERQGLWSSEKK